MGTVLHLATGDATGVTLGEIEALRTTATLIREQIADLLRADRGDHWRDQAQRLALARPATPEDSPCDHAELGAGTGGSSASAALGAGFGRPGEGYHG